MTAEARREMTEELAVVELYIAKRAECLGTIRREAMRAAGLALEADFDRMAAADLTRVKRGTCVL